MLRYAVCLYVSVLMGSWAAVPARSEPISIANGSFELPGIDANAFPVLSYMDGWTEIDVDALGSTNTGVFANTPVGSWDHVVNADGSQLAFLGSEQGNGLEQELNATYQTGCSYRLTVAVGISGRFPPSGEVPVDMVKLVLYYREDGNSVDIVSESVAPMGITATQLQDFSVYLPTVQATDAWADKTIGVAIRAVGMPGGFWDLDDVRLDELLPVSISIANGSFELPGIDPNAFPVLSYMDGWTEIDVDALGSTNTGVFANTPVGSWDHVVNADGSQLAFLGSEQGNGLEQELNATYQTGCSYRLTVAVGISGRFPPSGEVPVDMVKLVLYYREDGNSVDIVSESVAPMGITATQLQDFSVYLPTVQATDAWADKTIGVAIRAVGMPGGFWDLDDVRLAESLPGSDPASIGE
jgi:hypothetical protein